MFPKLEKKEIGFKNERDIAQNAEDNRDLLSKYKRAKAKKENLEKEEKKLEKIKIITTEELQTLRKIMTEVNIIKEIIAAKLLLL